MKHSELTEAHLDLGAWRSPIDFQVAVGALHRRTPSKQIFNDPRRKFLLDAWTLAEFAVRQKAVERVRLALPDDRWPDGYVRVADNVKNVEVTVADMPGRRMGDEYKRVTAIQDDPVEDWIARADAIPGALDAAISRKVAKRYSGHAWLVVYLNLSEYGIRQQQTELVIAQVKQHYASAFDGLFVLWKDKVY